MAIQRKFQARLRAHPGHTQHGAWSFRYKRAQQASQKAGSSVIVTLTHTPLTPQPRPSHTQRAPASVDFSFDVYFHSRISDPRCQAVVEVILVERMNDGVVRGRYSLGWATLPLFKVRPFATTSGPKVGGQPHYPSPPARELCDFTVEFGFRLYVVGENKLDRDQPDPHAHKICTRTSSKVFKKDADVQCTVSSLGVLTASMLLPCTANSCPQALQDAPATLALNPTASFPLRTTNQTSRSSCCRPAFQDHSLTLSVTAVSDSLTPRRSIVNQRKPTS